MEKIKVNDNQAAFIVLLKEFIESYAQNHETMPISDWLAMELKAHMPDKTTSEISSMTSGILSSLELTKTKRESLDRALSKRGGSKERWFAQELKNAQAEDRVQDIYNSAVKAQGDTLRRTGIIDAEFTEPPAETAPTPQDAAREIQNAAVLGSTVDAEGYQVVGEVLGDASSPHSRFIEDTLISGDTTGLKAAAAGALKTGSERGMLPVLPADTSDDVFAGMGYMAVEKTKAAATKLPFIEIVEEVERNALAVAAGTASSVKGASVGAAIGSVFGPVGTAVGGVIGGVTGFIAGSRITHAVVEKVQEVRTKVVDTVASYVAPVFKKVCEGVKAVGKKILGWLFG
ncbi:MAG: hypothetical protein IJT02_07000 [Synergistaceae bacterium]|nr:hypothetical protein [Synergistaceae bacterium]